LYAGATACVMALQWIVVFGFHIQYGYEYSSAVLLPLLTTIAYAFTWADSDESPQTAASTWERVLERSWAVIVLDLGVGLVQGIGFASVRTGDPINLTLGIIVLVITAPLVFADTSATVDDMPVWWILPGAVWRAMRVARGPVYLRAVILVALAVVVDIAQRELFDRMHHAKIADADFWSQMPINALAVVPVAALTALVYRDAKHKAAKAEVEPSSGD